MIITKFETWWVERGRCLFDEKRQGGAKMGWDVIAIKLTTDTGIEGVATCPQRRCERSLLTGEHRPCCSGT